MIVLVLERVPATLRGELSRWLIEPRVGVFIGDVSAMVRDRLWEKAIRDARGGGVMLLHASQTEQGFQVRIQGETTRDLVDWEGLTLVHIPSDVLPSGRKRPLITSATQTTGAEEAAK